ncbi:MAG: anthranilate phosphoribosyltransferase [Candidatus Omnitrophica bacterium]|nr:anthranilate phosphoribosyltransferase [Candidatus Omnitrophota bacterium]
MNIKTAIKKVVELRDLSEREMYSVLTSIMTGCAESSQIGAFITALRMKGETVDEITGAAKAMRQKSLKIKFPAKDMILDTCGTGGSGLGVFNVSTACGFVLAACGVRVAKHGNSAVSSASGSADVLKALGVKMDANSRLVKKCIQKIDIGFLYAPLFHKAMKYAAGARKEIGIRTIFNVLGPLTNPAGARRQVLGVYKKELTEILANVLKKLGVKRAYVVHGMDSLDEVTITARTRVTELRGGKIRSFFVSPADFGFKKAEMKDIKGGSAKQNAKIIKDVLNGKKGPKRDMVLMNSSVALMAADKAKNFKSGVKIAAQAIDTGRAAEKLEALIEITNGKS